MIPYIIINGSSSKNICGLLIQNLPPISKPQMRTSVNTVDGRDGDIVTPLGFAAYDKSFKIGLHGQYNVDDVISFFNSSGEVIFSNELDKYYRYAIYEQIDLEKLIRFKTATVTMHVQPFKYSAEEPELKFIGRHTVRNTGNHFSKPIITLTGDGNITLTIGAASLQISLNNETIVINTEEMNAYDLSGNFLNRQVTGDYSKIKLAPGLNDIEVPGTVQVEIKNYSRWI